MARPLTVTKVKGTIGHTLVRHERGRYNIYKCFEPKKYRKIGETFNYDETIPYRNLEFSNKLRKGKKANLEAKPPSRKMNKKPLPLPKTPRPKKVVKTMEATLKAKDKALERIAKPEILEIKEKERPQKVAVQLDSKTSVMVYPEMVEHARERYRQRHKQSQEQSHQQQRSNPNRTKKVKEAQSDLIFFH